MMKYSVLLAPVVALASDADWEKFLQFKHKFGIEFETQEEDAHRFGVFQENMARAAALNKKGDGKAAFGVTKFSHLTNAEFTKKHMGFKPKANRVRPAQKEIVKNAKAGSIDWRTIGGVSPVKDQGQCGSCWAFSATQAIETGYYKSTGTLKILSPQQITSCDDVDGGCNGGDTPTAYQYVEQAGGIETEADYPYKSGETERTGQCKSDSSEYVVKVTDYKTISSSGSGESDMYDEIQESPMSICVAASSWQMYTGGVVDSNTCDTQVDHCVHLVGYKEGEYWIVKNSWNTDWGEDGYIRVKTGENACEVASEATIAIAGDESMRSKFAQSKRKFNLNFGTSEENEHRFGIFEQNMKKAAALSKKAGGKAHFGATKFSHLTAAEFKQKHMGFKGGNDRKRPAQKQVKPALRASSIDWRTIGGVSPVKDQGQCGSCWAFSATEAIETGYYKATGTLKILSPQQITSCDTTDLGCNGGNTETAYQYVEQAGGIETEDEYPYQSGVTERTGKCKSDSSEYVVKVSDYNTISSSAAGESDMYSEIQESPMSICVAASSWQMYTGGVVDDETCDDQVDHCVHLVGYKEGEYWIVKNSWNTNWGEDGYIRVKTGQNACQVASDATIAIASDEDLQRQRLMGKFMAAQKLKKRLTSSNAVDLIRGLSEGFGLRMEEQCINASDDLVADVETAYAKMQEKTIASMMEAMKLLAEALKIEWPAAAKACQATEEEMKKIAKALEIIEKPKEFVYHVGHDLVINGVDIFKNMNDSIGYLKKKEYHDGGYSLGVALNLVIIGDSQTEIFA